MLDANGGVVQTQNNVWSSHTFTGLFPGNYIVNVVEPISGCSGSNTVLINQIPISLSLSTSVYDVNCYNGSDGKFFAHVYGGTPPYNFTWSNGVTNISNNDNDSMINLSDGNYIFTSFPTIITLEMLFIL